MDKQFISNEHLGRNEALRRLCNRITCTFLQLQARLTDKRGDEYGEKAVILGLVVILGIAAWAAFGQKVTSLINQATAGM